LKKGFTLIELLVVIAVIALLLSIVMPALQRAKELARRAVCSSNLKQSGLSLHSYGAEYDSHLPLNKSGWWLWDLAYSTTDYMIQAGASPHTFYCPSEPTKHADELRVWCFTSYPDPEEPTGSARDDNYRVTGYLWMMDMQEPREEPPLSEPGTPPKKWVRKTTCKQSGDRELAVDATLSTGADPDTASFTEVYGGLWDMYDIPDRTNHLDHSVEPAGGNVVFVDGHVEWRHFEKMQVRFVFPYHWW
jgi:prepilin-type N-terminal cleavage/methylation domain-containing protein/prepilin-type processing-associated H-X9-DG protein